MTPYQIKRLLHLHERVQRHLSAYWRFSADLNMQSKAISHLRKAARLHSHIAAIISDSASVPAYTGEDNSGGETLRRL